MSRRIVKLVERRSRELRLPRPEVDYLRAHACGVIDVQPGFAAGSYRLTPRGYVGFLDGPTVRFEIRPKLPWPNLRMLLGLADDDTAPAGEPAAPSGELLAVHARELARQLDAVSRAGLVRGYHEADHESPYLRGRLRTADQLRDAAARAFPDHFHVTESVFDLDTPWNRIPKAVGTALLAHPDLPPAVRAELTAALAAFEGVTVGPVGEADFDAVAREPRAAAYTGLIALCRTLRDGLAAADLLAGGVGAFLIDLGRAFEAYLTRGVRDVLARRRDWSVEAQPRFALGTVRSEPVVLHPDLVIRRAGVVRAVLDAKWKRPGPAPADLHQVLAYAALTGAPHVGLVYPGRRTARHELAAGGVRVSLFRVQVVGPTAACRTAVVRLAHAACR